MIDEISALVQVLLLHQLLDEVYILLRLEITIGAVVPAGAAHGKEVADVIRIIAELHPGRDAAQGETAEGPVIPGGRQGFQCGIFRIGVITPFDSGHQISLKVPVEFPQGVLGRTEIPVAVIIVEGGGHGDDGPDLAVLDQVIQHVLDSGHAVSALEVLAGAPTPAMHQIQDVVAGFSVARVIAIGQINGGLLLHRGVAVQVVLRVIGDPFNGALMLCWGGIRGRNRGGVTGLWNCQGVRFSFRTSCAGSADDQQRGAKERQESVFADDHGFVASFLWLNSQFMMSASRAARPPPPC